MDLIIPYYKIHNILHRNMFFLILDLKICNQLFLAKNWRLLLISDMIAIFIWFRWLETRNITTPWLTSSCDTFPISWAIPISFAAPVSFHTFSSATSHTISWAVPICCAFSYDFDKENIQHRSHIVQKFCQKFELYYLLFLNLRHVPHFFGQIFAM